MFFNWKRIFVTKICLWSNDCVRLVTVERWNTAGVVNSATSTARNTGQYLHTGVRGQSCTCNIQLLNRWSAKILDDNTQVGIHWWISAVHVSWPLHNQSLGWCCFIWIESPLDHCSSTPNRSHIAEHTTKLLKSLFFNSVLVITSNPKLFTCSLSQLFI